MSICSKRQRKFRFSLAAVLGLMAYFGFVSTSLAQAGTWKVCQEGWCDYITIQAAISAASTVTGDTVLVSGGTYYELVSFDGSKTITLKTTAGAVIDGDIDQDGAGDGSVVSFLNGNSSTIDGFTIQHGEAPVGGGIYGGYGSSPTISCCTIVGNTANSGGGIYIRGSTITNCIITNNTSNHVGGGIHVSGSTVTNCVLANNTANHEGGAIFDFPLGKPAGEGYSVTLDFLEPSYNGSKCGWAYHPGEDWDAAECPDCDKYAPVWAISDGVIEEAKLFHKNWGRIVLVRHDAPTESSFVLPEGGTIDTVWSQYAHMYSISDNPRTGTIWQAGDVIYKGEQIGTVGDYPAGSGENYHLHFEIRKKNYRATIFPCNTYPDDIEEIEKRYIAPTDFINLNR